MRGAHAVCGKPRAKAARSAVGDACPVEHRIGDRRAEYLDLSSSALYLSFWVGLLGLFLIDYRNIFRSVEGRFSLFILTLVAVNVFTGGYSLRFLALGYPFVIIAIYLARPAVKMMACPAFSTASET